MGSKPIGISGSRAATVLGLNSFQSQFELWQMIMEEQQPGFNSLQGYVIPEYQETAYTRWGNAFEDSIIKLAEEKAGTDIIKRESLFYWHIGQPSFPNEACPGMYSKVLPWGQYISCHIDGLYKNEFQRDIHGDYKLLHEGKTTSQFIFKNSWGTPGTDRVTRYIQCQVQHQLLCTGAEQCIVSVLVFPRRVEEWEEIYYKPAFSTKKGYFLIDRKTDNHKNIQDWATVLDQMGYFHQYQIQANHDLHKIMIEKYKEWWNKHIIEKQEPVPENTEDIKRLFPEPVGTIVADERIEYLCSEYKQIGQEISKTGRLGKRRENIKVAILDWMRKQDSVMDEDSREKTIIRDRAGKKLVSWNGRVFR